jgi:hypothetical protein
MEQIHPMAGTSVEDRSLKFEGVNLSFFKSFFESLNNTTFTLSELLLLYFGYLGGEGFSKGWYGSWVTSLHWYWQVLMIIVIWFGVTRTVGFLTKKFSKSSGSTSE